MFGVFFFLLLDRRRTKNDVGRNWPQLDYIYFTLLHRVKKLTFFAAPNNKNHTNKTPLKK